MFVPTWFGLTLSSGVFSVDMRRRPFRFSLTSSNQRCRSRPTLPAKTRPQGSRSDKPECAFASGQANPQSMAWDLREGTPSSGAPVAGHHDRIEEYTEKNTVRWQPGLRGPGPLADGRLRSTPGPPDSAPAARRRYAPDRNSTFSLSRRCMWPATVSAMLAARECFSASMPTNSCMDACAGSKSQEWTA